MGFFELFLGRYAKEVCDAIVAKCLTGRPKTVEKAQMIFMLWVELEAVDAFLVCTVSLAGGIDSGKHFYNSLYFLAVK